MPQIFSFFLISYFSIFLIFLSFFFLLLTFSHVKTHKSADIIPDSESTDNFTPSIKLNLQHHYHPKKDQKLQIQQHTHLPHTQNYTTLKTQDKTSKTYSTGRIILGNYTQNSHYMYGLGGIANRNSNTRFCISYMTPPVTHNPYSVQPGHMQITLVP